MALRNINRIELLAELDQLDRRIAELRGASSSITYDLDWSVKERERLRCHLNACDAAGLDGAA